MMMGGGRHGMMWYQQYQELLGITVVIIACVIILAIVAIILFVRMNEVRKQSEQLHRMRHEFIANISHELRTPVTVLRGSLEALDEGVVNEPEKVREYYDAMLRETTHLERLVNDLIALTIAQGEDENDITTTADTVKEITQD